MRVIECTAELVVSHAIHLSYRVPGTLIDEATARRSITKVMGVAYNVVLVYGSDHVDVHINTENCLEIVHLSTETLELMGIAMFGVEAECISHGAGEFTHRSFCYASDCQAVLLSPDEFCDDHSSGYRTVPLLCAADTCSEPVYRWAVLTGDVLLCPRHHRLTFLSTLVRQGVDDLSTVGLYQLLGIKGVMEANGELVAEGKTLSYGIGAVAVDGAEGAFRRAALEAMGEGPIPLWVDASTYPFYPIGVAATRYTPFIQVFQPWTESDEVARGSYRLEFMWTSADQDEVAVVLTSDDDQERLLSYKTPCSLAVLQMVTHAIEGFLIHYLVGGRSSRTLDEWMQYCERRRQFTGEVGLQAFEGRLAALVDEYGEVVPDYEALQRRRSAMQVLDEARAAGVDPVIDMDAPMG